MPQGTRVLRREQRRAWRGFPTGRHPKRVRTTWGRAHQRAAYHAAYLAAQSAYISQEVTL